MEELIIVQNKTARRSKDVKLFNYKWYEQVNGIWEEIKDAHFSVTHLAERHKNEIVNLINETSFQSEIKWDQSLGTLSFGELPNQIKKTYNIPIGKIDHNDAKKFISEMMSDSFYFDEGQGTINYELMSDRESRKYDYIYQIREKNIVDDMIDAISNLANHAPIVICEDPTKEEEIEKFISNIRIDQKELVKELLENGSISYEKCFNCTYDSLIGLRKLEKSRLTKVGNVYNYGNDEILTNDNIINLDFYPNEEFDSYRNMMEKLMIDYKIDSNLKCSFDNVLFAETLYTGPYLDFFIKKSFVPRYMFNVNESDESLNIDSFYNLLENTIFEFYENLIRSNEKFRYYNFSLFRNK